MTQRNPIAMAALAAMVAGVLCFSSVPARAQSEGAFAAFEGHWSLFTVEKERSIVANTFGYGLRMGYRWPEWAAFLQVEHNMWLATEYETDVVNGAVNIAVGGDYVFADGLIRTSLAVGISVLAFDTLIDDAGSVGLFAELRPLGLRWEVAPHVVIGLDPLTTSLVAPVLDAIPLVMIQYRSLVYVEGIL